MTPIPDPLPPPPDDAGQGAWGSQPIYSRADDLAFAQVAAAAAADAAGWTHAAKHLNHYLDDTGDTLTINADELLRDVHAADAAANSMAATEIRRITTEASAAKNYDNPVQFQSQWSGFYITRAMNDDWFFADGGIQLSVTGVVTVPKPAEGAEPSITAEYKIHMHDRYNWDGNKSTEIAGVTISDRRMGALHTAGLAREYDINGSSGVRRYEGTVPSNGPVNLPGAPGGRDGDRSDPTR